MEFTLSIGALSARTGVAASALRYYEDRGLIAATRTPAGHRRFTNTTLRRVSFILAAQQVGLTLEEIEEALAALPADRAPTEEQWSELAAAWRPRLDARIAMLERLRDRLDGCIGCGCLSMRSCGLLNPGDIAADHGPGPRYVLDDE
ncbi:MAG: redox-sensitive transcriptional activator SoxR [Acidimicrobiia bacterium]|nr:redox-sensitive transcriptional activator SoxR [Acidimicrobiia bacterium]